MLPSIPAEETAKARCEFETKRGNDDASDEGFDFAFEGSEEGDRDDDTYFQLLVDSLERLDGHRLVLGLLGTMFELLTEVGDLAELNVPLRGVLSFELALKGEKIEVESARSRRTKSMERKRVERNEP